MARTLLLHLSVLALGIVLYFTTGPRFVWHPTDTLSDKGDAIFNAWLMAWDTHALDTPGTSIWDAPQFYPARKTLGFSETMFGTLWYSYPINHFTGNLVLAAHVHILLSFVLCMYTVFILVRGISGSYAGGVVAGALFSFNPFRWGQLAHMNLLPFYFAPLALLCLIRFLETEKPRYFYGMVLAQAGQYYMSLNLGTLSLTLLLIIGIVHCILDRRGRDRWFLILRPRMLGHFIGGVMLGGLLLLPLGYHYLDVMTAWDLSRSESENTSFSVELLAFIKPSAGYAYAHLWPGEFFGRVRGEAWIGLTPLLLSCAAIYVVREKNGYAPQQVRLTRRFLVAAWVCGALMLGPNFVWMDKPRGLPMPYLLVFYGVPGGQGMRTPYRFFLPMMLCVSILAGYFLAHLQRTGALRRWPILLLLAFGIIGWKQLDCNLADNPGYHAVPQNDYPPVYRYLATGPHDAPVLELPITAYEQFEYQLYQTAHWRPLVNGYSGSFTPGVLDLCVRLEGAVTPQMLDLIALSPARTVVIHLNRVKENLVADWDQADLTSRGFVKNGRHGDAIVWEREGPLLETSPTLILEEPKLDIRSKLIGSRAVLYLHARPGEANRPWRFLESNHIKVTVTVTREGKEPAVVRRKVYIPPYLLVNEVKPIKIDDVPVRMGEKCKIQIESPALLTCEFELNP